MQAASSGPDGLDRGFAPEGERPGRVRVPGEGGTVAFPGREEAAGPADAAHFADDGGLFGEVDEDLVGEDDVEGGVREGEAGEDVAGLEGEVAGWIGGAGGEGLGLGDHGVGEVDAGHGAVGDEGAEAGGDGAGTTAEVEDPVVWFEVGKEECGVFGCSAGCVGSCDGLVVALRVAAWLAAVRGCHDCHSLNSREDGLLRLVFRITQLDRDAVLPERHGECEYFGVKWRDHIRKSSIKILRQSQISP